VALPAASPARSTMWTAASTSPDYRNQVEVDREVEGKSASHHPFSCYLYLYLYLYLYFCLYLIYPGVLLSKNRTEILPA